MKKLNGMNVLLTGASRGLGTYMAETLAGEGVNLGLAARSRDALESLAAKLTGAGIRALPIPADLSEPESLENVLEIFKNEFGHIDILVNNAGIEWISRYDRLDPAFIEKMIRINLTAPMLLTRLVLPEMIDRGSGHIVSISSLGGKKGPPYAATYAASKAGLIEWTRGLREELRGTGVSASVVCPGFVAESGMFAVYNKPAPKIVGETTPELVAAAVIKAVKKNVGEIVVKPGPYRPMLFLDAVHPGIISWLLRRFGLTDFYRSQAAENEKL